MSRQRAIVPILLGLILLALLILIFQNWSNKSSNDSESATHIVTEVSNLAITADDPLVSGGSPDPDILANAPATPPEFSEDGAHAQMGNTRWDTQAIELDGNSSQSIPVSLSEPSLIQAKADWFGLDKPIAMSIESEGSVVLANALAVPPDRGTLSCEMRANAAGDYSIRLDNPSSTSVKINLRIGVLPLSFEDKR